MPLGNGGHAHSVQGDVGMGIWPAHWSGSGAGPWVWVPTIPKVLGVSTKLLRRQPGPGEGWLGQWCTSGVSGSAGAPLGTSGVQLVPPLGPGLGVQSWSQQQRWAHS